VLDAPEVNETRASGSTQTTLKLFHDADYSFHVPARTGRKDGAVRAAMLDELAARLETAV
jgi:hypothetical protein